MEAAGVGEDQRQRDDLVLSFCGVTSASREVALFFLESHNWILDAAIASFYEQEDDQDQEQHLEHDRVPPSSSSRPRSRSRVDGDHDEDEEEEDEVKDDEDYLPPEDALLPPQLTRSSAANPRSASARVDKKPAKPSGNRSNIRTFADLSRSSGPGSESDSDDEPQGYYTGGEKSGMLVQDPKKGRHDVDSLFEQARQIGAMPGHFEPQPSSSSRSFTGTSRLLSGETVHQQPSEITRNIYFWSNGFTVDDGPLRRLGDPENASFLESIARSECPEELAPANKSTLVKANLIRREEDYSEPARRAAAFQGVGKLLGSGSSSSPVSETAVSSDNVPSSTVGLSVDDSKPSTSIQLRLADGTRMVARFNTHHTVGDVRSFIDSSRPGAARMYQLQTVGFPPKQLNDLSKTIEEAGLANSVIIQRL